MPGIQWNNCPCADCCVVLFPWNWYTYYGHKLHQVKATSVRPEAHELNIYTKWNFTTSKLTLLWGWPSGWEYSLPYSFAQSKSQQKGSELQLKVVPSPAHQIQVSCDSACRGNLHCWPMPGANRFDHVGSTDLPVVYCPSNYVWIACFCWRAYESWSLCYVFFWLCRFSW